MNPRRAVPTTYKACLVAVLVAFMGIAVVAQTDAAQGVAETRFRDAEAVFGSGDADAAIRMFDDLIADYPVTSFPGFAWRAAAAVRAGEIEIGSGDAMAAANRFVTVLDQEAPSNWTARARLGLATTLASTGAWPEAANLLQEVVSAFEDDGPEADFVSARSAAWRLTLLHRVWVRPQAGQQPWDRSGRLPVASPLQRPIGIAAHGVEILITDEGVDAAVFIDAQGTAAPFAVADVRRPWWSSAGSGFVGTRDGVSEPLRLETFQFAYADGSRQRSVSDVGAGARRGDGGWVLLDRSSKQVRLFDAEGAAQGTLDLGPNGEPVDIADDIQGRILVIDKRRNGVLTFNSAGVLTGGFGSDTWREPYALATDEFGFVYVLDRGAKTVHVFDSNGTSRWVLGPVFPGGVELRDPRDLAVDAGGRILIADRGHGAVIVIE